MSQSDDEIDRWHACNRAGWDESVAIHLRSSFYDVEALRSGRAQLYPIERAELGAVAELSILHLQCHHTLGDIVSALAESGLTLEFLHEHDAVPWRMYDGLRVDPDRMYRWPSQSWLPLAFSLSARLPRAPQTALDVGAP